MADTQKQTEKNDPAQPDSKPAPHGGDQVAKAVNAAAAQGHFGVRPDPTPLEHYTLPGVLAGKATPETDEKLAAQARAQVGLESQA